MASWLDWLSFSVPFGIFDVKLLRPEAFLLLVPGVLLLVFLVFKSLAKVKLTKQDVRRRRKLRAWLFVTRIVLLVVLILALAEPYGEVRRVTEGSPRILLLVDNSTSMQVFDRSFLPELKDSLEAYLPVSVRSLALGEDSFIGDGILQNLEQGANVLLVTDGRVTGGTSLDDVGLFATNLNATVSTIELTPKEREASVFITGPRRTLADVENTYAVGITSVLRDRVRLTVQVDDEVVLDEDVELEPGGATTYKEFKASFQDGYHKLTARISGEDFFAMNNEYYMTVKVLEKPKILYVGSSRDPLLVVLRKLFDVEVRSSLPDDLEPYYAVVVNDVPAEKLRNADKLGEYLIDENGGFYGNGLVVFGGFDSFERGGYKNSPFESLLPVRVGKAQKKKGNQNLMFVIDVSGGVQNVRWVVQPDGSLEEVRDKVAPVEMIKNRVIEILEVLDPTHRVGANAFGISTVGSKFGSASEAVAATMKRLEPPPGSPMNKYYDIKKKLIDEVVNLRGGGNSFPDVAFRDAVNLLSKTTGDKRIILLTDGKFQGRTREQLAEYVESARRLGIQTFVIGVGRDDRNIDEAFLRDVLAKRGDGVYVPSREVNKVKILFGDPENKEFGDDFTLFYLSLNHFITRDMDALGVYPSLNGWNQVVPKASAQLLATTDAGDPALTVWKYGNGRVAALTVFRGDSLGPLLTKENSILVTRILNWAVGDPERKAEYFIDVPDVEVGKEAKLVLRSKKIPSSEYLEFTKEGPNTYSATFSAPDQGFSSLLGAVFAVNYVREYKRVGVDPGLQSLAEVTWSVVETQGGAEAAVRCSKPFKPAEVDRIVSCAKTAARRVVVERTIIVWPLIALALVVYLVELVLRRRYERRR
ncbi:VWA domain-containing protein [Candidatus Woesearchaeota archaeon]|nr:MAG: VWA domain-containing protein [Candidatus Woesearchaeota archaeon]